MGVGCCVRVLRARSSDSGQSRRVRREGCRGSTGWGLYKGPIPIVNCVIVHFRYGTAFETVTTPPLCALPALLFAPRRR